MASPIPNGIYTIRNAEFPNYSVRIIDGCPYACRGPPSEVKILEVPGGFRITNATVSADESFANANQSQGASLVGNCPAVWVFRKLRGDRFYEVGTPGGVVWELPGPDGECVKIVFVHPTGELNTVWLIEPVKE